MGDSGKRYGVLLLGILIIAIPILLAYYIFHIATILLLFVFILPGFLMKKYLRYFLLGMMIGAIVSVLFFIYVILHLGL